MPARCGLHAVLLAEGWLVRARQRRPDCMYADCVTGVTDEDDL